MKIKNFLIIVLSFVCFSCEKDRTYEAGTYNIQDDILLESHPTIRTTDVTNITHNSATTGGDITNDGGTSVNARGVCYSTMHSPTIADEHTNNGSGGGSFTSNLSNLSSGTTYYVRAYATTNYSTIYGESVSFTLQLEPCPGAYTICDCEGHTYHTIQIGSQCWMRENLRATKYANNTNIIQDNNGAHWYYPDGNYQPSYGLLYNWKAVQTSICPDGWHVPSDAEWTQLTDYVSEKAQYVCGNNNTKIAKSLASTTGWVNPYVTYFDDDCAIGKNIESNNTIGFSVLPAGNDIDAIGACAWFWSSTERNSTSAYYRRMDFSWSHVERGDISKNHAFSVRCVKD